VSGRTYLSIGDVLTLLREEFPDVTISKIRFLESQGLVNPERSPSGYRKFFETDVERLRWVLRQQREHFLPLKVIRDRLAAGDLSEGGPIAEGESAEGDETDLSEVAAEVPEPARRNGKVAQRRPAAPVAAGVTSGAARGGLGAGTGSWSAGEDSETSGSTNGEGQGESDQLTQADSDAMARILADASRRSALLPEAGPAATPDAGLTTKVPERALRVVPDIDPVGAAGKGAAAIATASATQGAAAAPAHAPSVASGGGTPGKRQEPAASGGAGGSEVAGIASGVRRAAERGGAALPTPTNAPGGTPTTPTMKASDGPTAATTKGAPASGRAASGTDGSVSNRAGAATPTPVTPLPAVPSGTYSSMVTGASFTSDELCAASGLSEIELAGLQGFGLIESQVVAGILTFDEDALTVATLAMQFRKFGIEPRHLKLYRNAVDREMGLIEQVIIPLLRQRNPESRQRAVAGADEMAGLGQTMRAALLRAALRRHLGG
jgi:DNA-binding transcriptional MerR regulator